jgi:molybdopterin converting factor small subunit
MMADTILVTVHAFSLWQMILGTNRQQVATKGRTLRDLIRDLNPVAQGKLEKEVLSRNGSLDPKFRIFVNGNASNDLNASLSDGDDVVLFAVIDGG